jgi:RimJ/RimL family protein N-acetyltransferase
MIVDDRIRFRAIEQEDIPTLVRWINDPEVRQWLSFRYPVSIARTEEMLAVMRKKTPHEQLMAIEIQPEPEISDWIFIGFCGFDDFKLENRSAELGICIGEKEYWSQGFGTRANLLLLKLGFEIINLHRIFLYVFETNQRAIRSYEKIGFTLEGKLRESRYINGRYENVLVMSILKHEWQLDK